MRIVPLSGGTVHVTGRALARKLRNGSAAERDRRLSELQSGELAIIDLTAQQARLLVAGCLVGSPRRPPTDEQRRAHRARQADKAVEKLGEAAFWDALDRRTLPLQAAE